EWLEKFHLFACLPLCFGGCFLCSTLISHPAYVFKCDDLEVRTSVSFGIIEVNDKFKSVGEVLKAVDEKLYEAKKKEDNIAY
ncbi:MAG TPA: diguanylate cyclase, partial [Aquifex aeolicus]|nr:diguanylate cyclase [Aquifex aeolicus]